MTPKTMAAEFISCKMALDNCVTSGNTEWEVRWRTRLGALVDLIPHGSGIDVGPRSYSYVELKPDVIRFDVEFHHMNDVGSYDGWTSHTVTIRPAFDGLNVSVSGRNRNEVKDHIHEVMEYAFTRHVSWDEPGQRWEVESDDDRYAAMRRAYPDHCSNLECPKLIDDDAHHVDGACERRDGAAPRGFATW